MGVLSQSLVPSGPPVWSTQLVPKTQVGTGQKAPAQVLWLLTDCVALGRSCLFSGPSASEEALQKAKLRVLVFFLHHLES